MEDSLEDFIKLSKNTKNLNEPLNSVSKEILVTAQIKKECDTKAVQLVEFAIDGKLRPETLFKCLPHINQSHYQDIVEERAISKLCGYPLCGKRIPDMPKKQYHISTKSNKVYDITERKHYCSNYCYKASLHIKKQIDDSPLWLRKHDEDVRSYTLLSKNDRGLPGTLIDQGIAKSVLDDPPSFTPVSAFTEMSLDELEENELINPPEEEKKKQKRCGQKKFTNHRPKSTMKSISEDEEDNDETTRKNDDDNVKQQQLLHAINEDRETLKSHDRSNNKSENNTQKPVDKVDDNDRMKKKVESRKIKQCDVQDSTVKTAKSISKTGIADNLEQHLLKCFKHWINLETLLFIYDEKKVVGLLKDQKMVERLQALKIQEQEIEKQREYRRICQKLLLKEMADEKFDKALVGDSSLRPIPDYKQLKEESKLIDLKVKSFYSGSLSIAKNSNRDKKIKDEQQKPETGEGTTDEGPPAVLPLTENSSQKALRRKIFLNSLNKALRTLLQHLRIESTLVVDDVQALVKTFELEADNIVFKPAAWTYIAIGLLKILSQKDGTLRELLEEQSCADYIEACLDCLPHKGEFINEVLEIITDVDKFLNK